MALPADSELTAAWREIRAELRRVVGESTYVIWLAQLEAKAWDGNVLVLQAPSDTQAWLSERFGRLLESAARAVFGTAARIVFVGPDSRPVNGPTPARLDIEDTIPDAFNPRYSFDQFIIGDGNRLAHAASLAVAELPGQAYNPLFLHAPPGLGKTHLLHAIGNYILAFGGGATVRYTTVEAFTNHFINALSSRSLHRFKRAYRDPDVLLIDDVQFLASKVKTEEEFFHTFNALYETGRQLVLTCDRLPRQLVAVEERLRERFESGLVADIRPPDLATRVAILRKRAALDRIVVTDPSVLELIAARVSTNVRSLEGALIRVVAYHSLTQEPIDGELATKVLDTMYAKADSGPASITTIQATVAAYFEITVGDLVSPSRAARVSWPRMLAIHLARELTSASLQAIGDAFGHRNHATVLHACKRVSERLITDDDVSTTIGVLVKMIAKPQGDRDC